MSSTTSNNKIVLTTPQILEAYAAHGNDFIVPNFEATRKHKSFSQYINIDIKLADDSLVGVRFWKLSNNGIVIASRIRKPEQRKYESIRMGVNLVDEDGNENDNMKAAQLLCIAFEEKMKQFKDENIITDDARAPRKQADGTSRPFHLISTKIVTPMQTTTKTKDGDIETLVNPLFWLSIPKKKAYGKSDALKPPVHFEDKYYADDNGQPDMERPVMSHEYEPTFDNIEDFYHHPRTGKKIYKRLGAVDPNNSNDNFLDNTNIQDYLTKGSALMGNLKFEIAVSGRQCKLDIALYGKFYVKVAERSDGGDYGQDEETIDAFANRYISIGSNKQADVDDVDDFADEE